MTLRLGVVGGFILLTAATIYLERWGQDEPFFCFGEKDAVGMVGGGGVLVALWIRLMVDVAVAVARRRLGRGWLGLLPWAALCTAFVGWQAVEYTQDVAPSGPPCLNAPEEKQKFRPWG